MKIRIVAIVLLTACMPPSVNSKFTPETAEWWQGRLLKYALVAYEGDVRTLVAAKSFLVGTLQVDGRNLDSNGMLRHAMVRGAELGGTHVIVAGEYSGTYTKQFTNDRYVTQQHGNTATTTHQRGLRRTGTTHAGGYLIVRVEPENWLLLSPALQPRWNTHFSDEKLWHRAQYQYARH